MENRFIFFQTIVKIMNSLQTSAQFHEVYQKHPILPTTQHWLFQPHSIPKGTIKEKAQKSKSWLRS
jgi:hypothetical protein